MRCAYVGCVEPLREPDGYCRCRLSVGSLERLPAAARAFLEKYVRCDELGVATLHRKCWDELRAVVGASGRKRVRRGSWIGKVRELVDRADETLEVFDSEARVESEALRVAELLLGAGGAFVFTGAGISTNAGIGDYRGIFGKWTEKDLEADGAGGEAAAAGPPSPPGGAAPEGGGPDEPGPSSLPTEAEEDEGVPYEQLRPTLCHEALSRLTEMGLVAHIASQNCDGLHLLSGVPEERLGELHGNVFVELCRRCKRRVSRNYYVCYDDTEEYFSDLLDYGRSDLPKPPHCSRCRDCGLSHSTLRWCEDCGAQLEDSIVNFGDDLPEGVLEAAERAARGARLHLSLGTLMTVTPANSLVERGLRKRDLVIVNRQKTHLDSKATVRIFGDCDKVMAIVMERVLGREAHAAWLDHVAQKQPAYDAMRAEEPPPVRPPKKKRAARPKNRRR